MVDGVQTGKGIAKGSPFDQRGKMSDPRQVAITAAYQVPSIGDAVADEKKKKTLPSLAETPGRNKLQWAAGRRSPREEKVEEGDGIGDGLAEGSS